MQKKASLLGLLIGASLWASVFDHPVTTTPSMLATLTKAPVMQAGFHQTKTIQALAWPLVSSGNLVFSKADGLIWTTTYPFLMTLVVTSDTIWQTANGNTEVLAVDSGGFFKQFRELFQALFDTNLPILRQHFDIYYVSGTPWTIGLVAKANTLASQLMPRVVITGDDVLHTLTITEANGNTIAITLTNHQPSQTLTDAQATTFITPK